MMIHVLQGIGLAFLCAFLTIGIWLLRNPKWRGLRDAIFQHHPTSIFFTMIAGFVFLAYGPVPYPLRQHWRGWPLLLFCAITILVFAVAALIAMRRRWLRFAGPLLLPVSVGIMLSAGAVSVAWFFWQPSELKNEPYFHVIPFILSFVMVTIVGAWKWGGFLVRKYRTVYLAGHEDIFQILLYRAELFDLKTTDENLKGRQTDIVVRLLKTPFIYPFQLAFFMAAAVLVWAPRETAWIGLGVDEFLRHTFDRESDPRDPKWMGLVAIFLVVTMVYSVSERWVSTRATRYIIDRYFFFGGQFLVSVLVTILGFAYFANVQEVVIMIDAGSGLHIFSILISCYCAFWIYETWLHFVLNYHLLSLFAAARVQRVHLSGSNGSFSLTFHGQSTGQIPVNASAAVVQAALNNLSSISDVGGSVSVSQAGADYLIVFGGEMAEANVPEITGMASDGATISVTYFRDLKVDYPFQGAASASGVSNEGRSIHISGARFVAVGRHKLPGHLANGDQKWKCQVKTYEKADIFEAILASGAANIDLWDQLRVLRAQLRGRDDAVALLQCLDPMLRRLDSGEGTWTERLRDVKPQLAELSNQLKALGLQMTDARLKASIEALEPELAVAVRMFDIGVTNPKQLAEKLGMVQLSRWIQGYFAGLNAATILAVGLLFGLISLTGWLAPTWTKEPELRINTDQSDFAFKGLPYEIFENAQNEQVILVAGSGGGTRAALFTTAVLQGLQEQEKLKQIKLCSGVSGGSAAFAYLAINYDDLIARESDQAWIDYTEAMAFSYIDDVLCGAAETRLALGKVRLGTLLADSFHSKWIDQQSSKNRPTTLGEAKIGLIFNTTLAGQSSFDVAEKKWKPFDARTTGTRLILTNAVAKKPEFLATVKHEILAESNIPLAKAAALSANFPPVFANALIEIHEKRRYYVTDGGASENQGLVSLLGALRETIKKEKDHRAQVKKQGGPAAPARRAPPIVIIAADASALSVSFKDDRGLQPMQYSGGVYAEELEGYLIKEVTKMYYDDLDGTLTVCRLHMPEVFRARGGVTTHWMLAETIEFTDPVGGAKTATLPKKAVQELVAKLYLNEKYKGAGLNEGDQKEFRKLQEWLDIPDDPHHGEWTRLVETLNAKAK